MDQPTLHFGNSYKEQINRGGDFFYYIYLPNFTNILSKDSFSTSLFYPKSNGTFGFDKKIWNLEKVERSCLEFLNVEHQLTSDEGENQKRIVMSSFFSLKYPV